VAHHYNARPDQGIAGRRTSKIIRLRSFNNWVKMTLIRRFAASCKDAQTGQFRVLDLGCGKGGDLHKWGSVDVTSYVGCDIAEVSVEQAKERRRQRPDQRFTAEFHALDCFGRPIWDVIDRNSKPFDAVSMQFCLHYAFETEERARQMLRNVSEALRPGGMFIGTLPDANWIVRQLQKVTPALEFGNRILNIRFDQRDTFPIFGHRYHFALEDAIDDCPEYLVHFPTLASLAMEYGLRLVYVQPFPIVYETLKEVSPFRELLFRMRVKGGPNPEMSREEWEVTEAYLAFAFER
ncbi:MAG: guanine-N(7)-methyltransferase domain-containing protein, partial [Piptocephalis tieghemiana]